MSMLEFHEAETSEGAMDVIEQALISAEWACERSEDQAVHCAAQTRWGECAGVFAWRDQPPSIQFSLTLDLRAPAGRRAAISELLCRVNERLWLGHFDYWSEDGVAVFRHTLPMLDRTAPEHGEISAVIAASIDAVEQFLPAFNFVVWAGKSPAEAMEAVLFETAGEA